MCDSNKVSATMVARSRVYGGIGLVIGLFILVQLYLLHTAPPLNPVENMRYKSSAYNMVKNFLKHCDEAGAHCIMVDPFLLGLLVHETLDHVRNNPCRFMCKSHIYTFAVREADFEKLKMTVLPDLRAIGYSIQASYNEEVSSDVATHVYLRNHENHAIHIVILHRKTGWWWYGADPDDEHRLDFTRHDGALDEFEYDFRVTMDGIDMYMPHYPKRFLDEYKNSYFIPCNETRARLFHDQYPRDTSRNATEFRLAAGKAIKLIKSRLDGFGVPFWISSGTLLGWHRQCDYIPYSVDVDVGVFIKDHTKDLLKKLQGSLLHLEHKFGRANDSLQYAFDMGKVKLDIFFFYVDKLSGKMWNGGTDYNTGEKFKYLFEKFSLCWTEFDYMKLQVPCETEPYIQANYGPNWFHPVKKWDWSKSPPNVKPNGEWSDDEMDEVIQLWDKKGKRLDLEWIREEL